MRSPKLRARPSGPKVRALDLDDWPGGYVIVPRAVRRIFSPVRRSMFVSTHCFDASISNSKDFAAGAAGLFCDCADRVGGAAAESRARIPSVRLRLIVGK